MKVKKQSDIKDCGISIIQALYKEYYNIWLEENPLKIKADYGDDGINIRNMVKLGKEFNIEIKPYDVDFKTLKQLDEKKYMIAIVKNNNMNHYILFKKIKNKIHAWDSIKGFTKYTLHEFGKIYQNIILDPSPIKLKKVEQFRLTSPFNYLFKNTKLIGVISFSIIISISFLFFSSIFMKIIIDKVIPSRSEKNLTLIVLFFLFIYILRIFNGFLKNYFLKIIDQSIKQDITMSYMNKLESSSNYNINKITNNDHIRRIGLIEPVSSFLSSSIFLILNEVVVLGISLALMIWISYKLFAIILAATIINTFISLIFRKLSKEKYDKLIKSQLGVFENYIELVNNKEEQKNKIYNKFSFNLFRNNYKTNKTDDYNLWKINTYQSIIETIFSYLIPLIITFLSTRLIFDNKMSVGVMLMFISLFNYYADPLRTLVDFVIDYPINKKNMDMLNFVLNLEDKKEQNRGWKVAFIEEIEIKKYRLFLDKTIANIDYFKIDGHHNLTGPNGSGKTTFLKSLAYLENFEGEVKINEMDINSFNFNDLRKNILLISSKTFLSSTTIYEFITLNDDAAKEKFNQNINKYNLHLLLRDLNIDLGHKMYNNGENYSSGQKQIMNLMRLFAFEPEVVLLDEAFENIDHDRFLILKSLLSDLLRKKITIEVSHSKRYIFIGKELKIEGK